METRLLDIFLAVVQQGSFAAAARQLDLDPSYVSRSIAALETEYGVRLFQRTTRQLALTEAGTTLLGRIEPVLSELQLAREEVSSAQAQPGGKLRISASVAFGQTCLMPHVDRFISAYPEIDLQLLLTDTNLDLIRDTIDLAIRLAADVDNNLIHHQLMPTHYRVCASPDYLKNHGLPEYPHELSAHRCVCFTLPDYNSQWRFKTPKQDIINVVITPRLMISNALALKQATVDGIGPALLADWLIREELQAGSLVDVFPAYAVTATTFDTAAWLVYPARSFLPAKTRALINFLNSTIKP